MNFFNINLKKGLIIALLIALPLLSINMEQKSTQTVWFAQPITFVSGMLKNFFATLSSGVKSTTAEYLNLLDIKSENRSLNLQIGELSARMLVFIENQNEIERLRMLLEFKSQSKMELIPAQVIGRDLLDDHDTITINKGIKHGLKNLQAVITVSGVIGYIFRPDYTTSHVMLVTDRYAVVDALLHDSRAHGIFEGQGKNKPGILQYVDRTVSVKPGDLVVTGGIDNIFPKGYPLALVTNVETKSKGTSLLVSVKPVVDANKVEEVFIVSNAKGENYFDKEDVKPQ